MKVEFKGVYKRYGKFTAVNDLNLTIENGALHFLLGPSGCGKTTTLRMLAGLESVSEGQILFDGKDVTNVPASERGIGMVFQNYALWPHMTVYQNIEYGLKLRKLPKAEVESRIKEVLDFTQLTNFSHRLPGQLSGGQQQRVALARALAIRPNVLLLDEPLSNLDAKLRLEMRDNISRIHKQTGITTLYVTHDQKESLSMGTGITVMHSGHQIQTGTPRDLYNKPESAFLAGFIGETNLIPGKVLSISDNEAEVETSLGKVLSKNIMAKLNVGDNCTVSVRPEAIAVKAGHHEVSETIENKFSLPVEHVTYLGESEQLKLSYGTSSLLRANLFNPGLQLVEEGEKIECGFYAADVALLPEEEDLGPGT
jgi:ABC-type Fe3+/spermidine/putrescine transport system ATPase subunit